MYNKKKILAFIPARLGSKGIPQKNLKMIGGEPLFMHSVHQAFDSQLVDAVLVSSDSPEILQLAHQAGCIKNPQRPQELADDKARIIDSMLWELKQLNDKYDAIVLLQPTYPLRPRNFIDSAIKKYFETETSLISVVKTDSIPEFIRHIKDGELKKIMTASTDIRRQDIPVYHKIVGSIYINNIQDLTKETILNENKIPYLLDNKYDLDINTEKDWDELLNRWGTKDID